MDKKLLKQYKLEETVKRLNQICEYTFITSPTLAEDGDEEMNSDADGEMNQDNELMDDNSQQPQGQSGNNDGDLNSDETEFDVEDDSIENDGSGNDDENNDLSFETEEMQSGDEVVDIDDLTQSQQATEYKVDDTNRKLTQILNVVNKFSDALDANSRGLEELRNEFEKRNPTEEERLNLRSQASYPYSEQPKDYWDNKMKTNPNYNVMYDNDVSTSDEQKKFEIKKSDIGNINFNEIGKSFSEPLKLDDFLSF